jgi:Arc/MetJ family transcription regulator
MKTTINIPDDELRQVMEHTGSKTKRDAVVIAIRDYNRRQRLKRLTEVLGTFENFMTQGDLHIMREDEAWKESK